MSVPSYKEIEIPLLLLINSVGGKIKSSDCYKILAKHFELSEQEIISVMSDGTNRPRWNNMVQWARNSLLKNNYIYDAKISGTGIWSLTEIGKEKAIELSNRIEITYPDDISEKFFEGAKKQISVNKYERSKTARDKCIDHYGYLCNICTADFFKTYGDIGKDFIHVHHITPISEIGFEYELDPVRDLRPICPNCHAMAHRQNPPLSIEDLRKIFYKNKIN